MSGVVSLGTESLVGRQRPYAEDCGPDGQVLTSSGTPLFNHCGGAGDNKSFVAGHASAVTTMAGLTCVHHQHLPLYGGGLADLAPCLFMVGAAAFTGVSRITADKHWASDVLMGWTVGALSGYVVPSLLHYGFTSHGPIGEIRSGSLTAVPIPMVYPGGAGLGIVGFL
jgi:membrane-associated phospholipid phosphatase